MKRFQITKLRLTSEASARLEDLGLSLGDLNIVISLGHKINCDELTFYIFNRKQLAKTDQHLAHLVSTILIISSGRIIDVCRDTQAPIDATQSKKLDHRDTKEN
jgi:hypothetical protein